MKKITFLLAMLFVAFSMYAATLSELSTAISTAQTKHNAATEGAAEGNYDVGSKALFQTAIDAAKVIEGKAGATQTEIDNAYAALARSSQLFDYSKVVSVSFMFNENFGSYSWRENFGTDAGMQFSGATKHYFNGDEKFRYTAQDWDAGTMRWPGASKGNSIAIGSGKVYQIQKIDTRLATTPKLKIATRWGWGASTTSISTTGESGWTALTKPADEDLEYSDADWQVFSFVEELPKVEDLWIKIEANSGSPRIDDIIVYDEAVMPASFGFNVAATGVAFFEPLKATASKELFNALDLKDITDVTGAFVLKEGSAAGADVPFAAALGADKKTVTITPTANLEPLTTFYLALKARSLAAEDGIRIPVKEMTFKTRIDTIAFYQKLLEVEAILANPAVEGECNGDKIVGSAATLRNESSRVAGMVRDNDAEQYLVGPMTEVLGYAIGTYNAADVVVDYDGLNASIGTADAKMKEADYATKYIQSGRENLTEAYNAAKTVSENNKATQVEVNTVKELLDTALANLWKVDVDGSELSNVVLAPNPADNFITISGVENATVIVYGVNGTTLISIANYNGEDINISSLAAGVYNVKVNSAVYSLIKK